MASVVTGAASEQPWRAEARAFGRAFAGAFLFGIPLLFTMEMWWIGAYADRWKLLVFLLLAFVTNLALAYFAGFREDGDTSLGRVADQAVDAVAVGVVGAVVVLLALNRITLADPLDSILGKVIIQAVPLSIGASLANAVFTRGASRNHDADDADDGDPPERDLLRETLNDVGATAIGAIFISFSIAPTEEVTMLAVELDGIHELAVIVLSLLIGYAIVFVSGFDPQVAAQGEAPGPFQRPLTETVLSYLVSLAIAFLALFLFDQIELGDPFYASLSEVLVLGLPATVGGAAGRLAI